MDVILLQKVRNLGNLGDEVKVRPGYGRNFLIPSGRAVRSTEANRAQFESRRAELERQATDALSVAEARAASLREVVLRLVRRATEEGRLFGSVGTSDVADAMAALGHDVTRAEVVLSQGAIKDIGDHEIMISLHPEVEFKIRMAIVTEG